MWEHKSLTDTWLLFMWFWMPGIGLYDKQPSLKVSPLLLGTFLPSILGMSNPSARRLPKHFSWHTWLTSRLIQTIPTDQQCRMKYEIATKLNQEFKVTNGTTMVQNALQKFQATVCYYDKLPGKNHTSNGSITLENCNSWKRAIIMKYTSPQFRWQWL